MASSNLTAVFNVDTTHAERELARIEERASSLEERVLRAERRIDEATNRLLRADVLYGRVMATRRLAARSKRKKGA